MRFASKYMKLEKIKWSEVTQAQMLHVYLYMWNPILNLILYSI